MQLIGFRMKNKLMIAGAGAGKTHFLVQESLKYPEEKILITTYTQENERSITQRFISINGCVPKHVTIQTWFSFLLQHGVKPFQGSFNEQLFEIKINGLIFNNGGEYGFKIGFDGQKTVFSEDNDFMKHYFVGTKTKILSDRLSKFVVKSNEKAAGAVISRISKIFTHIYVDEVQDLAGYDLALLKLFFESSSSVLLVGDPRQTTYLTNHCSKFGKYKYGKIKDFLNAEVKVKKTPFEIDEGTLSATHRGL
jgi:DNA helicase II / ATP-dependent DNA helicase PcrA